MIVIDDDEDDDNDDDLPCLDDGSPRLPQPWQHAQGVYERGAVLVVISGHQ